MSTTPPPGPPKPGQPPVEPPQPAIFGAVNRAIVREIYRVLEAFGAEFDLLGTVGSWGDSLPEEDVLANLRHWNSVSARKEANAPVSKSEHDFFFFEGQTPRVQDL